ncbi:MAG: orotate phosphoribosyltransferase [Kiritimatiellae bacterium]|nr:orotate phosphoribosyltransferase [Kiritimatiellia bacterium]MDD5521871.1 orotate phosphoribosyltransferase [Kiritimatiellia bacterium]
MEQKEILGILKESGALLDGHFELRSGLHSDRYFQCANVLRYPRLAAKLCDELVEIMKSGKNQCKVDGVISPAMGGIIVGHEIARSLGVKHIFAEKQDGELVMHRFQIMKGEKYIVAEDVITRGGRVLETIDIVEEAGAKVEAVAVLVDRSGGKARFTYPTYSLLQIEPVTYEPAKCPLCAKGVKFVHPGS